MANLLDMIRRNLETLLRAALRDRPVVFLHGARQVGKSTLARSVGQNEPKKRRYLTLDDAAVLAAAKADPDGFVAGLDGPVVLDEVQHAPELLRAIKAAVDRDRRPGRFLLTGSANALVLPRVAESLAGRMEILTLWPLSQDEIEGRRGNFVDALFKARPPRAEEAAVDAADLTGRIVTGGYPEIVAGAAKKRRAAWFGAYLTSILQRDVRELANIEGLTTLPKLLGLLASRMGGLLNFTDLARTSGLPQTTVKRYVSLLEATFLVRSLPAWFVNVGRRLAKSPKTYLTDTGLAAHLLGMNADRLRVERTSLGPLLEAFVVMELRKQVDVREPGIELHHFRTSDGREVDAVLEDREGRVVGIEVKAGVSVGAGDLKGMHALAEAAGRRFHRGVVLYTGGAVVPFAANVHAVPMGRLWGAGVR